MFFISSKKFIYFIKFIKSSLFFLLNPVPFNEQIYQKQGLELVTSPTSGHETSSEKFL